MFGKKKTDKVFFNPGNRATGVSEEYAKEEVEKIDDKDVEVILSKEEDIDKKFSGSNTLGKYLELGKIMMQLLKDSKRGHYKNVPWFTIATIVLAFLYILNPMDLIPDFIPGIGYIDDIAMLSIGIGWIETDLHRYLDWKVKKGEGITM
jgi:uncharacterized membrane protein YkvA (DUF1232 family)